MKIQINAKKMPINQSFTELAEKKINSKLSRFFHDDAEAFVMMSTRRDLVTLELTVRNNNIIFRAEQSAEDKADALSACIDRIIRQIRKNKTKVEKRLKENAFKDVPFADMVEDQSDYEVVRRKVIELSPMSVDEAILQMNLLGHSFFLFKDGETGNVNLVYRRDDGNFAVLEPLE